mgnify:CR=1 FL=1
MRALIHVVPAHDPVIPAHEPVIPAKSGIQPRSQP